MVGVCENGWVKVLGDVNGAPDLPYKNLLWHVIYLFALV